MLAGKRQPCTSFPNILSMSHLAQMALGHPLHSPPVSFFFFHKSLVKFALSLLPYPMIFTSRQNGPGAQSLAAYVLHNIKDNLNTQFVKLNKCLTSAMRFFDKKWKRCHVVLSLKLCSCASSLIIDLMHQYLVKQISHGVNWIETSWIRLQLQSSN